jgi:hypothetical protein
MSYSANAHWQEKGTAIISATTLEMIKDWKYF